MLRRIVPAFVAGLATIGALACSNPAEPGDLKGVWGAEGVKLTVGAEAVLNTSCFVGHFPLPASIGGDGTFEVDGTTTAQGGAPPPEPPQPQPATFAGVLRGDRLTLTVNPGTLGSEPYHLRKGVAPDIPGCP
jgi:hypothetical protein